MSRIIFTSGQADDDEVFLEKGHRSDVLLEDDEGFFYVLNFISIGRLESELKNNRLDGGVDFYADLGLVVVREIKTEIIIQSVQWLLKKGYFALMKRQTIEFDRSWFCIDLP